MYWNIALEEGGISNWGWRQNSLLSVDTTQKTYKFNYEYYLLKHLSHYVMPGARLLSTGGDFKNLLAFINPDKTVILVIQNDTNHGRQVSIKMGNNYIKPVLKADSFNTFVFTE